MPSIVIAAHNEETVIGRCLESLLHGAQTTELDITVVANGCTDATASVARRYAGVRVVELSEAGKPRALNAGDAVAQGFPRIYLDADIELRATDVDVLCAALRPPIAAATTTRKLDLRGRPLPVRAYFAINSRLPVFQRSLFGRGAIAVSREGRSRFAMFPDLVADDLFLDGQFSTGEKCQVGDVISTVATPWTTRDLFRRLVRVRGGNASMRAAAGGRGVTASVAQRDALAFLKVALRRPTLIPAAAVYAAITVASGVVARRRTGGTASWGRDESTRRAAGEEVQSP